MPSTEQELESDMFPFTYKLTVIPNTAEDIFPTQHRDDMFNLDQNVSQLSKDSYVEGQTCTKYLKIHLTTSNDENSISYKIPNMSFQD